MKPSSNDSTKIGDNSCLEPGKARIKAMKWAIFLVMAAILFAGLPLVGFGAGDPLTAEERIWLKKHDGKIIVNNEAGWPPIIDMDKDGNSFGIVMDFQRLIEKKLNFKFKLDKLDSWEKFMDRFRQGEIDVNNNLQKNPKRTEYALFTKPYIKIPNVIIVRKEIKGPLTLEKMRGMKIAVTNNFAIYDYIKNNYGYLQLVPLGSDLDCLLETSTKDVDAAVVNLAVASFIIEKMGITNLRVAGDAGYSNELCFASRKDLPILNRILEKGLNLITQEERAAIYRKWISLGYVPFYKNRTFWIVASGVSGIIIAIILMILAWNRSLKKQVKLRTEKFEKSNDQLRNEMADRKRAEEALRTSEERYRNLVENSLDAIILYRQQEILFANEPFFNIFGYEHKDLQGIFVDNILAPEAADGVADLRQRRLAGEIEKTAVYESRGRRKDGEIFDMEISVCVISHEGEQCCMAFLSDISKRKQAEEALRESEKRLKGIFESIPSPIVVYSTEGHPLYLNPAFTALFHWSLDELKGQRIPFVPDDQKELTARKIGAVYKTGKIVNYETRRLTKKGDVLDVIVSGAFVAGPDGKPVEMVAIMTDITGLKRAEEALRESEEKYRTVLESNPDPVIVYDMEGRVIYLNPAFTLVFGWSLEEQIGKKIDSFVPEKNMPETRRMIKKVTVSGESFSGIETRRYTKEGNILDISISGSSYRDHEGNVAASVINLRDITEQKRLEDQLQKGRKMEAMGLMAGGVAHDLNNILSGIVSYPELLLMDLPEDSPLKKPIKTIQESGMRAADVVEDLMTIARGVATGKDALNLNTIVTEYLGSAEHLRLERTHSFIDFKTELDPDLFNISGSSTHIKKTLMNLAANASEAIEGVGTVTISTVNQYIDEPLKGYEDVHTGEYVVLSVADDGSGITPKDLERIFEPFYTKKVMGRSGTGLGLAVVWNTVQDHNGYINVESSEKGTAFELYFPVTRENVAARGEEVPLEDHLGHGEKILVVDDAERQREIASGILTRLGYNAETVSSGEKAIEYMKEHPVDLIVLDMAMPRGINGRETYEEIIKIRPGQKAVIASGYSKTKEVDIAQELGAGKYIKKPYTLAKVGLAVKEELEK
jgi:two-component system cell cycle sensor histidine kinase/response regulator CckA